MAHENSSTNTSGLSGAETMRNETPLFSDFVEQRYLPFIQENKRSWKVDQSNLRRHILPYLGACRLSEISSDTLLQWVDSLALTGLSHNSCFRQFWVAKYVLNCAVRWGVLKSDAAFKTAKLSKKAGRRPVLLNSSELVRLLGILADNAQRPAANAIRLMLLTGGSKSEILGARWEDVDFIRGVLAAQGSFTGRRRLIPLNNEAQKLLHKLPRQNGVPWLFFTSKGTRLNYITRDWYRLRKLFGRPELRLQDLRHSFADYIVKMGANSSDLRVILGHYKPETLELVREELQEKGLEKLS